MAQVSRVRHLSPHLRRITLVAPEIAGFGRQGGDHFVRMLFAPEGRDRPVVPGGDDWWGRLRAMPGPERPVLRNYTVRRLRPDRAEIDVDIVLHDGGGPGSRWGREAVPGSVVGLIDQYAMHTPGPRTDWQLICGDETALPAIGGILEALDVGARAEVFVEVPGPGDVQDLMTAGEARVHWLHRDETGHDHGRALLAAVRAADLPTGRPYAWVAGEAATVAGLRRHLTRERGVSREEALFCGYWRRDRPAYR